MNEFLWVCAELMLAFQFDIDLYVYEIGLLYQSNAFTFGETEDYIAFQ